MTSGAEECGSSTAPQGLSQWSKPPILLAKTAVAGLHREARFSPSLVLTSGAAEIYKPGIRHAAASVRRRVFEAPHRYSVTRLPIVIGGPPASTTLGFDDPPVPPEGGITLVPGCLTGESEKEKRGRRSPCGPFPRKGNLLRKWPDETSAVDVSGQHQFRANGVFAVR